MRRRLIRSLVFSFIFPLTLSSYSQILKIDKSHLSTDSSKFFTGVFDASFNVNNRGSTPDKQNVYVGINQNADVVYVGKEMATILIGGINYFKIGDGPLVYNGSVHLREVFKRKSTLSPEIYGQAQFDESRNMELRKLLGGGLRWNILKGKNSLHLGLGTFREHERWKGELDIIEKNLWKVNTYLGGDLSLTDAVSFNTIFYFQSGWDEEIGSFRNRISGQIEIKTTISKRVKIKMASTILVDNRPIIPVNRFVYETYFGMEYAFGK